MIAKDKETGLESKLALLLSLEGNRDKNLTNEESRNNIVNNLVNVCEFKKIDKDLGDGSVKMSVKHFASGFLITTDGWTLTAYHNIESCIDEWDKLLKENPPNNINHINWLNSMTLKYAIVTQDKISYPIDITGYCFNTNHDIALIKAYIPNKPKPIKFKIYHEDLEALDKINLFALKKQKLYTKSGKVVYPTYDCEINDPLSCEILKTTKDTFFTDAHAIDGCSGGVFATEKGEFAGLILYIRKNQENKSGYAGGAKVKNILEIVKEMVYVDFAGKQNQK